MALFNKFSHIERLFKACLPLIIGIAAFLLICSPKILNPKNISWFSPWSGDPLTSYLGWAFYRYSEWAFPIGLNPRYGMELSSSIIFSDSIPIAAILFKLISFTLPYPFQYLGLWTGLCFILQAYIAWKLVRLFSSNILFCIASTALISLAPPFLHRINTHVALASHFLILFSLYLYFKKREVRPFLVWGILLGLTLYIHLYLFIMVGAVWVADILTNYPKFQTKKSFIFAGKSLILIAIIAMLALIVGYFQAGEISLAGGGYGAFKLNLLSLFDSNHWSYVVPDIKTPFDFKEGFNYLGGGLLLLLPFSIYSIATDFSLYLKLLTQFKHLVFILLIMTLASLTNFVSIGIETFTYPVPDAITSIGNIFRATGRFFWPVYYVIVIGIFYTIWNGFSRNIAVTLVIVACAVQIIDTSPGYQVVSKSMSFTNKQKLTDPAWNEIAKRYKKIVITPIGDDPAVQPQWESIALFAAQNKMSTNAAYLARPFEAKKLAKLNESYLSSFNSKQYDQQTAYVLNQHVPNISLPYPIQLNPSDVITRIDGINLLLPNWNNTKSVNAIPDARINYIIPINSQYGIPYLMRNVGNYSLNYGWAFPESWGTWSNGVESEISLIIPPGNSKFIEFEIKGFINANHPQQHFSILIENQKVYDGLINSHQIKKIRLPIPPTKDKLNLNVKFLLPDAVRPKDVGGEDHRKLGVALISAQFIP